MKSLICCFFSLFCAAAIAAKTHTPVPVEATQIKVLVALGPSSYFFSGGKPHGVEYAWLSEFEKFANQDKSHSIRLQFIPVDQGELVPALFEGRGDMAAGLLPASDGLRQLVTVSEPYLQDQWCVVGSKGSDLPRTLDEVAAHGLVLPATSYARRLMLDVNEARHLEGKPEITLEEAAANFTTEKLLGEINKGSKRFTLTSRFVLELWSKVFPKVAQGVCLDNPVQVVWAVKRENTALLAELNRFIASKQSKQIASQVMDFTRKYLYPDGVAKPSQTIDPLDKLSFFAPAFQLAASANNLDWLLLAAIGQRESGLNAIVRNNGGPTGVMQINPATARSMGVSNPHETGQNITAAARYLGRLRESFTSPDIGAEDRLYFMLAAYNGGEGRLKSLRSQTKAAGLDPNRWVGNVEIIAQRSVGQHMVNYVTAVSRYYLAYQTADRKRQQEASKVASTAPN